MAPLQWRFPKMLVVASLLVTARFRGTHLQVWFGGAGVPGCAGQAQEKHRSTDAAHIEPLQ